MDEDTDEDNSQQGSSEDYDSYHSQILTKNEISQLKEGDEIDHQDEVGRFTFAKIEKKKKDDVYIHYIGWGKKWNQWCNVIHDADRFARPHSISIRPAHRLKKLKVNDKVDINPMLKHPGWKNGYIRQFDEKYHSGHVQIVYTFRGIEYLHWVHLDNKLGIAEFKSQT